MISLDSWWWPRRPIQVLAAWTAGLLAALGAALFGVSALLLKIGAVGWDLSPFRILNQVPAAAASVLTDDTFTMWSRTGAKEHFEEILCREQGGPDRRRD